MWGIIMSLVTTLGVSGERTLDSAIKGFQRATDKLDKAIEKFDAESRTERVHRDRLETQIAISRDRSIEIAEARQRAKRIKARFEELLG